MARPLGLGPWLLVACATGGLPGLGPRAGAARLLRRQKARFRHCECCAQDWCGCYECPDCAAHFGGKGDLEATRKAAGGLPHLPQGDQLVDTGCLQIRESGIKGAGDGLFATCKLRKGAVIRKPYAGQARPQRELQAELGSADHSYVWCPEQVEKEDVVCVDAKEDTGSSNPLRYVNSARDPKQCAALSLEMCQFDRQLYFRATRDIAAKSELLVDYGPSYWGKPQCPELPDDDSGDKMRAALNRAFSSA